MVARKTAAKTAAQTPETDIARRIWLAGVGAYGRAFETAQGQFDKLAGTASEAFEQLVARGEALEDMVRVRISDNEAAQKVAGVVEKIEDFRTERRAALEARVESVRKTLGETIAPFNPLALSRQIEALTKRVEALEGKQTKPARKTAKR